MSRTPLCNLKSHAGATLHFRAEAGFSTCAFPSSTPQVLRGTPKAFLKQVLLQLARSPPVLHVGAKLCSCNYKRKWNGVNVNNFTPLKNKCIQHDSDTLQYSKKVFHDVCIVLFENERGFAKCKQTVRQQVCKLKKVTLWMSTQWGFLKVKFLQQVFCKH